MELLEWLGTATRVEKTPVEYDRLRHPYAPYAPLGTLIILSLDTTTRAGSCAVLEDDRVLASLHGDASRTHGERMPGELARVLEMAGVQRERIDLLAVAIGPGAFTGLRIGLAAIQGLAMALNKPVAGVSALDALAEQVPRGSGDRIIPWMDAQRGDVFAAIVDGASGLAIEPPSTAAPKTLLGEWHAHLERGRSIFIGDAVERDAAIIGTFEGSDIRRPAILAPEIARLGRRMAERGEAGPPHALEPIYVRRPDAEIERERRGRT